MSLDIHLRSGLVLRDAPGMLVEKFIERYYWYAASICDEPAFRRMETVESSGEQIFEVLCLMQRDVDGARRQIDRVLAACRGQKFAGASPVRVVESLIWHYYARAGSVGTPSEGRR